MRASLHTGSVRAATRPRCAVRASAVKVHASLCPYSTLGVASGASDGEIKQAYRKLVLQFHPDVNRAVGAERKFMSIQQAYELLTNKTRHPESHNGHRPDWGFHDWYWSFAEQRRWTRRAGAAGKQASAQAGPEAAVHKQPEHQATLRSQLAGLRHRAAIRSTKKQQQAAAAGGDSSTAEAEHDAVNVEYAAEMSDGCNVGFSGVTDWAAAEEQRAAQRHFSATESHKQQVMHQMAGLHRRAAAAQEASNLWQ